MQPQRNLSPLDQQRDPHERMHTLYAVRQTMTRAAQKEWLLYKAQPEWKALLLPLCRFDIHPSVYFQQKRFENAEWDSDGADEQESCTEKAWNN